MQDSMMVCRQEGHQGEPIIGICANKQCHKQGPVCQTCLKQWHQNHRNDFLDFDQFTRWGQEGQAVSSNVKLVIQELEQVAYVLREFLQSTQRQNNFALANASLEEVMAEATRILKMKSFYYSSEQDLRKLKEHLKVVQRNCEEITHLQGISQNQNFQQIKHLQEIQQEQSNINNQTIQFRFSQEQKNNFIKVSDERLFAESEQGVYPGDALVRVPGFCICDPTIPKTGVTRVSFVVIKESLLLGVCRRNGFQTSSCNLVLSLVGHSAYLMDNKGFSFSNHQQELNQKYQQFYFTVNDVITVEVDMDNEKITWIKNGSNQKFTMKINYKDQLCFCAAFDWKGSVEILQVMNDVRRQLEDEKNEKRLVAEQANRERMQFLKEKEELENQKKRLAAEQAKRERMQFLKEKEDMEEQLRREKEARFGKSFGGPAAQKQQQKNYSPIELFEVGIKQIKIAQPQDLLPDVAMNSLTLISKILENILKNPQEQKFRKISLTSQVYQNKIDSVFGAKNALDGLGFIEQEGFYVIETQDLGLLQKALTLTQNEMK